MLFNWSLAALIFGLSTAWTGAGEPDAKPKAKEAADAALEPEEVARRFFYALVARDKESITRYMLPHPNAEILWKGEPASDQLRQAVRKQLEKLPMKRLKVGDKVSVAGGREYVVEAPQVNENRVLLWPAGFSMPIALVKRPDGWRVKADSIIVDRQQAAAATEKKKAGPALPSAPDGSKRN